MLKYGLKIWTTNKEWFGETAGLLEKKEIDFVELYIVPNSFTLGELAIFKRFPTILHVPHEQHNFSALDQAQIDFFKEQVVKTADFLAARYIIIHPNLGGSAQLFKENIARINDQRIIIENMPLKGIGGGVLFGHSLEDLRFIKKCGFNICFDFVHAVKSALSQGLDYKNFIKSLIAELEPDYFHLSSTTFPAEEDEHCNLFEGDFDVAFAKKILTDLAQTKDIYLVLETPKKDGLKNDIVNLAYFKELKVN